MALIASGLLLSAVVLLSLLSMSRVMGQESLEELFGKKIYKWSEDRTQVEEHDIESLLKGKKHLGLYFSASWCGPCRQFTPQLAKFYEKMNKKYRGNFEIIWISGDRSPDEFVSYYGKMPWLAVPQPIAAEVSARLSPKYGVKGIPHFVMINAQDPAEVYTIDGRNMVAKDPYGLEFPWRARTLMNLMPAPVKRFVKAKIDSLKLVLKGMLESVSPSSLIEKLMGGGEMQMCQEHSRAN